MNLAIRSSWSALAMRLRGSGGHTKASGDSCSVELVSNAPDLDPAPEPPARPQASDCCRGGGDPCVFDLYEEALTPYQRALSGGRARHPRPQALRGVSERPNPLRPICRTHPPQEPPLA